MFKGATTMDWVFLAASGFFVLVVIGSYVLTGYFSFLPVLLVGTIIGVRIVQMRARGRAVGDG